MVGILSGLGCSDHMSGPDAEGGASTNAGEAGAGGAGASNAAGSGAGGARSGAHAAGRGGADLGPKSDAGAAGEALTDCTSDAECDDGLRCNGEESCVDGACRAGNPSACSNAATCVEDAHFAPCAYPGASPWLVYLADEDTPDLEELYAVKESLIGVQVPIKLNAPLPFSPGKTPRLVGEAWSDDGQWLVYGVALDEKWSVVRWYAVGFDAGAPSVPIELTKDLPAGQIFLSHPVFGQSASSYGHSVLLRQTNGDLYRVDLTAKGASAPFQLNLGTETVVNAEWALGGTAVTYTSQTQAFLINPDGAGRAAFADYSPTLAMDPSANGSRLSFREPGSSDFYVAKVAPGEAIVKVNGTNLGSDGVSYRLSGDGRYVTYSASEKVAGSHELYLVDLLHSPAWSRKTLLDEQQLSTAYTMGGWAPDSSYFVFFADDYSPDKKNVYIYDVASGTTTALSFPTGLQSSVLGFTSNGGFLISDQRDAGDTVELRLVRPNVSGTRLHTNSLGKPYQGAQVAPNGSGAVFCNGAVNEDLYYLDLRDAFGQAVKLPGEGSAYGCSDGFASDSKGFVYYRTAPDGSRTLYWSDTSHQVLGKPVQVTRSGRARTWTWQPWVNKAH